MVLNRRVREDLHGKGTFDQGFKKAREELLVEICWKGVPDCGNSQCKGAEVGVCLEASY